MGFILDVLRALIRIIATASLLIGLMVLGFFAAVMMRASEGLPSQVLGQVWFQNDPFAFLEKGPSIQLVQVFFERKLAMPVLWDPVVLTILNWPSWAALLATSAVFLIIATLLFRITRRRRAR